MAKTRIVNLAKELKIDVKDLIQRLKDDLGMSEHFTYLSSLDEPVVARVRQFISVASPQMEELRVGENVKRRRRVAPVQVAAPEPEPQVEAAPEPSPPKEAVVKPPKPKEKARIVALPPKEKVPEEAPPPRRPRRNLSLKRPSSPPKLARSRRPKPLKRRRPRNRLLSRQSPKRRRLLRLRRPIPAPP